MFPENNEISLSPGNYDLQVYVYSNSTLKLPASEQEQCVDVPRAGVLGMVGLTKKECTTVEFPEQVLTSALIGGGKAEAYLSEVDLINSKVIEISGQSLNVPKSLEELQENYLMVENRELEVNLI
jgi:hypothetical protein